MKVTCKITGEDKTSWLLNKWEKEREAKELQDKISKDFGLFDEWMEGLIKKNGTTKY
jgi:superoxide dismutase